MKGFITELSNKIKLFPVSRQNSAFLHKMRPKCAH